MRLNVDCTVQVSEGLCLPSEVNDRSISDLVRNALECEGQRGNWTIDFAFLTLAEITHLHAQFLGDPSPTDIMTFPHGEPDMCGGDIAICLPVAVGQAPDHGNSPEEELFFLVLHGVLHLTGHNDATAHQQAAMLNRQSRIYSAWSTINR